MAVTDIKSAIINNAKGREICDVLHDVQIAATEEDMIAAGLPAAVFAYQSGIVNDILLSSFDEAKLNAAGVYTIGTFTITNPPSEVFIAKTANVTINLTGTSKAVVNVMGNSSATIVMGGFAYLLLKIYNSAVVTLTLNDDSICLLNSLDAATAEVVQNDNSIVHIQGTGQSAIGLEAHAQAFTLAKMYDDSVLGYELFDTAVVDPAKYQNAIINNNSSI